jgi:rhamnopyranosyl-N-acetylglucosaminyl-diphospho-decaprenol beta-1,3/1,4-galactofuranosyltransferase
MRSSKCAIGASLSSPVGPQEEGAADLGLLTSTLFSLGKQTIVNVTSLPGGSSVVPKSTAEEDAMTVRTAVVILTFNRCEQVCSTIGAVLAQKVAPDVVVLVDNGSSDSTVESVRAKWPDSIEILELGSNLGAAAGRAAGMLRVAELEIDWCWIVDDDSPPRSDALAELIAVGDSVSGCVMVGVSGGYRRFGVIRRIKSGVGPNPVDSGARSEVGEVDFVHLDGSVIRVDAIRSFGVPRADYFIMMEDVEYPLRLKRSGGRVLLVDADLAELKHLGSGGAWRLYYQTRNELLMARDLRSLSALFGWAVRTARFSLVHARRWRTDSDRFKMRMLGAWHGILNRRGMVVKPDNI